MNTLVKPPTAREVLRAAIAARDEAATRVREAAAALARATQLACEAKGREVALGDVDGQILAHATAAYRAYAENGGDRPVVDIPVHLAERRESRDAVKRELAAAQASQAELAAEHAASQREHERRERRVATAADAVIAEMVPGIYGQYLQAIRAARAAWDDLAAIYSMTVQVGPRWADRMPLPGLPPGLAEVMGRGFGYHDELPPGQSRPLGRSAAWEDLRRRLRQTADAT